MTVLSPISCPELDSSGPPELPGLMAASDWMQPGMKLPVCERTSRFSALMTPAWG
jgi:hypothetical protein